MVTQRLNLNTIPSGNWPRIAVSQGDIGSRAFIFTLYAGTELYTIPSGSVVIMNATKPDGNPVSYECLYEGSAVTAGCPEQLTVIPGNLMCELQIIDSSNNVLGTANFILFVEASPYGKSVPSEVDMQSLYNYASAAVQAAQYAGAYEEDAEAWAVGERNGVDVPETDETYHNNAKYYAGVASSDAQTATESARTASEDAQTARDKAGEASASAESAAESARSANEDAERAEWLADAIGIVRTDVNGYFYVTTEEE